PIATVTTVSASSQEGYLWTVNGPATTRARIRATWVSEPSVTDVSDADFTIASPSLTVTFPNAAISVQAGATQAITFTHTLGAGQPVALEISRDSGVTWSLIKTVTTISPSGTDAGVWTVTGPATTQARIRARWVSDPSASDISDADFTVFM